VAASLPLAGAPVLVTGGARGIGRASAEAFAARGAHVCVGDLDEGAAAEAAKELGRDVHGLALDVTSRASFERFLAQAEELSGPPAVLVSNAGVMPLGHFLEEGDEVSRRTIDVNLWGPALGARLVLPGMLERGRGHVVNVASMMGKLPVPGAAVYGATKHALVGLGATLREEFAGTGVSLTTVLPSAVRTELIVGVPLGGGLPVVSSGRIARAVVRSCSTRRAEVFVPWWLAGYKALVALAPPPLVAWARRRLDHDRVLTGLDREGRSAYERRISP